MRAEIDDNNYTAATKTAQALRKHAHRAHLYTTGPVWFVAAHIPLAGQPLETVRGIASASNSIADSALPTLVAARDKLDPTQLRTADGRIDLQRIESVSPSLVSADRTAASATSRVLHLPRRTWLGAVDKARRDLATQLGALAKTVHSAAIAAQTLPDLLGVDGPKHYFVVFQNEAEARGTGGLPGAFGIATATNGKVAFDKFYNDDELDHATANVDFGSDYDELYLGAKTTSMYVNSNLGSNYPYAAQIWLSMWQQHTGQKLDGAFAVDPTALGYLLGVTGPTTVRGSTRVDSGNVVALTESEAYSRYPNRSDRRVFFRDIAQAVADDIVDSHASLHSLVDAAGRASGERRLLFWSAEPRLQALIADTSVSGIVQNTSAPYVGLSIVNDGGNKLDYYLDRSITWQAVGCGQTRIVTVTVKLTNNAPATGLPDDVVSRSDKHSYPIKRGDNRLDVSYYATSNAALVDATLDRTPIDFEIGQEQQHPVFRFDVEVPRGTTRTLVLHLQEPTSQAAPVVLRQPLVRPLTVDVKPPTC